MGDCEHVFPFSEEDLVEYELEGDTEPRSVGWILTPNELGVREAIPDDEVDDDYVWTCPHSSVPDTELNTCVFHTESDTLPDDKDPSRELSKRLEKAAEYDTPAERRRHLQFIDARFDEFDFRGLTIGGDMREYVDLRHAVIRNLDWQLAEVIQRFRFAQAEFHLDEPYPPSEEYDFGADPSISFKQTDFRYDVDLRGATFHDPVRLHDAHFERWLGFKNVDCHGPVDFQMAQFDGLVSLWSTRFRSWVRANATTFENYVNGLGVEFHGDVNLQTARFHDDVGLERAEIRAGATLDEATFDRSLTLNGATIRDELSLSNIDLKRTLAAEQTIISGTIKLTDSRVNRVRIDPDAGDSLVTLRNSAVETGTLGQPHSDRVTYDFALAKIGDIQLTAPSDEFVDVNAFCRFYRTTYDGFDFNDQDAFNLDATGLEIYELSSAARDPELKRWNELEHSSADFWATYLHAKNGATQVGDNTTAGRFFKREMRYRANDHAARAAAASRLSISWVVAESKYVRNRLLGLLAGYGEEPLTVVFWSFVTIIAFTVPFSLLLGIPSDFSTLGRYLALSFQSFVSFLIGRGPGDASVPTQLLGAFEGLIGAFFVALFVFTLTRRIRR